MSSHPQISRFSESAKKIIDKNLGHFDSQTSGGFRQGFAKAIVWTLVGLVAITVPVVVIQQFLSGSHLLETASRIGLVILAAAFGQNINMESTLGAATQTVTFGFHPTGLTLLVVVLAYLSGRKFVSAANGDSGKSNRYALGLGVGASAAVLAGTWALQGPLSLGGPSSGLILGNIVDFLATFILVGGAAWLGTRISRSSSAATNTVWAWTLQVTRNFVVLYSFILLVVLLVFATYTLISPSFGPSAPEATGSTPINFGQIALGVAVILAYLPNMAFMFFAAGTGSSVGLQSSAGTDLGSILGSISGMLPSELPGAVSAYSAFGIWLQTAVLAVVAVVALIAGSTATTRTGYRTKTGLDFVQSLFFVVVIGGFASYLTNFSATYTSSGVEEAANVSTNVSFGIVLSAFVLAIAVIVTFAWIASAKAGNGLAIAFPRLTKAFSKQPGVERNDVKWVWFGRVSVIALFAGLVVYPVTSAGVNRVWASIDTPIVLGEALAAEVTSGDVEKLKTLIGPDVKEEVWFPDEVLKSALPTDSESQEVTANNDQKKPWVVGNSDATIQITWSKGDTKANWLMPTESKVENILGLVNHLKFSKANSPIYLNLEVSQFINAQNLAQLKVNGVEVAPSKYAVLPGFYRVTLPKQDLIAETDFIVGTDGETAGFVAGNIAEIPLGGDAKLDAALSKSEKKCESVSKAGKASCFSAEDITGNVVSSSAEKPSKFFQKENSNFKLVSIECSPDTTDSLLNSKTVKRVSECDVKATFTTDYYKGKKVKKAYPVYEYVCDEYYDEYWDEWDYDCYYEVASYNYVLVEQRGAKISSVTYTSEFKVQLSSTGTLKNGKFVVK